jgi:hypothetical protein
MGLEKRTTALLRARAGIMEILTSVISTRPSSTSY